MLGNTSYQSHADADPLWYKDAVIYQLHVKSYFDSNADGIGDFKGLTQKLDYLRDLGINAIWLLPFYPSPLKDDGYDISDYKSIHPTYGTLGDFKQFLRHAHRRGIRVITELVINHTSDQHPWFQRARRAKPGSSRRNWYVWSDTPDRYEEVRIIFQDFESSNWAWDPVAKSYFWHRFYSHQPDLNYDHPSVQKAIFNVLDFWLKQGVDGFRMDAVPYLFVREGTNCENLPETHEFLKKIRTHVDKTYPNRMLLAEANQWPEDAVAYFGSGDEFHMAFHFPLMPRLYMALHMEDSFPILDIMDQTPVIPDTCQWAVFLRNHDELTLEMVTDEERDYMYRVYARDPRMRLNLGIRRRLSPLLGNHRRRIELMNALLFSMPGTPIIYYGDEIGMGDNIHLGDRDGVRTPMQWSADRNAGFSRTDPQALYLPVNISPEYHFEVINVDVQQHNTHSMLWWMKRLIALRKRFKAFSRGIITFLRPKNHRILAFIRCYEKETILVVVNLSRYVQYVELDLSDYQGMQPVELFGRTVFPTIESKPYFLSLGRHSFFWFYLSSLKEKTADTVEASTLPVIPVAGPWKNIFTEPAKTQLENILSGYMKKMRWFGGKARPIKRTVITEVLPFSKSESPAFLILVRTDYMVGDSETYLLPITCTKAAQSDEILDNKKWSAIAWVSHKNENQSYLLHDGLADKAFCLSLLELIGRRQKIRKDRDLLSATATPAFRELRKALNASLQPAVIRAEQSNTSVTYGNQFILKLIRRLSPGTNPDLEIGRFLTEKKFPHTPPVIGAIEFQSPPAEPVTLSTLHQFVTHQGDAWEYTRDHLGQYFENALTQKHRFNQIPASGPIRIHRISEPLPPEAFELIGPYMESVRLIGLRTAQLHSTLASATDRPAFIPEPFTRLYQRSLYQSLRALASKTFDLLRQHLDELPEEIRSDAQLILDVENDILERFKQLLTHKITGLRIRCHGDYHLGQVLFTGKDFVIIDFEGEPARPVSERKIKRSPVRDVAGMLRSFNYAAYSALFSLKTSGISGVTDETFLESCANIWYFWIRKAFLRTYLEAAEKAYFLPRNRHEFEILLNIFLQEKAIYELAYELNNRPEWAKIPLQGLKELIRQPY
jgi:maltose alpha-D-glucosyltransferase / alpha-amylase